MSVKKLDGSCCQPLLELDDDIHCEDEEEGQASRHSQNLEEPHDDFHAWNIQSQNLIIYEESTLKCS